MGRFTCGLQALVAIAVAACGAGGVEADRGEGGSGGESVRDPAPLAEFECSPAVLDFGRVVAGQARTLAVECRNTSANDGILVVSPVLAREAGDFSHPYTGDGGRLPVPGLMTRRLEVTFDARDGDASASLEISWPTAEPDVFHVHEVELVGQTVLHAVGCGGDLNFGEVPVGSSATRVLTCTNQASVPFFITGLLLDLSSDQAFSVTPPTMGEVPAAVGEEDGVLEFEVVFTPLDSGRTFNGILNVRTADPNMPLMQFAMTGFGAEP